MNLFLWKKKDWLYFYLYSFTGICLTGLGAFGLYYIHDKYQSTNKTIYKFVPPQGCLQIVNQSLTDYCYLGGSGNNITETDNTGGIALGTRSGYNYNQCTTTNNQWLNGYSFSEYNDPIDDINAFRMRSDNGDIKNKEECRQLCCYTNGCTSALYSNGPPGFVEFDFYGCSNIGQENDYGIEYDRCCVLRGQSSNRAPVSVGDSSWSYLTFLTNNYSCGAVAAAPVYGRIPSPNSIISGMILPDMSSESVLTCINACMNTPNCASIAILTTYASGVLTIGSYRCGNGGYCCGLWPATGTSNLDNWVFIRLLPNIVNQPCYIDLL
jgi:hypothetical protein